MIVKWIGEHNYALTTQYLEQIGVKGATIVQGYIGEDNGRPYKGVIIEVDGSLTEQQLQQIDAVLPYCRREGQVVRDLAKEIDDLKARIEKIEKFIKLS